MNSSKASKGFSLLEMSLVLVIVSLLLVVLLPLLLGLTKEKRVESTKARLEKVEVALLGFLHSQGRLPRPDTDGDGLEDSPFSAPGAVPYATLGLAQRDARDDYGLPLYYDVAEELTSTDPVTLCPILYAYTEPSNAPVPRMTLDGTTFFSVPFAVMSSGGNKSLDDENGDGDRNYRSSTSLDDLLGWATYSELYKDLNCRPQCYSVYNQTGSDGAVLGGVYSNCTVVPANHHFWVGQSSSYDNISFYSGTSCSGSSQLITYANCQAADSNGDCKVAITTSGLMDY